MFNFDSGQILEQLKADYIIAQILLQNWLIQSFFAAECAAAPMAAPFGNIGKSLLISPQAMILKLAILQHNNEKNERNKYWIFDAIFKRFFL